MFIFCFLFLVLIFCCCFLMRQDLHFQVHFYSFHHLWYSMGDVMPNRARLPTLPTFPTGHSGGQRHTSQIGRSTKKEGKGLTTDLPFSLMSTAEQGRPTSGTHCVTDGGLWSSKPLFLLCVIPETPQIHKRCRNMTKITHICSTNLFPPL